jgi:hypothetical protein
MQYNCDNNNRVVLLMAVVLTCYYEELYIANNLQQQCSIQHVHCSKCIAACVSVRVSRNTMLLLNMCAQLALILSECLSLSN